MRVQEVEKRKGRKGQIIFVTNVSKFSIFYKTYTATVSRSSANPNRDKLQEDDKAQHDEIATK